MQAAPRFPQRREWSCVRTSLRGDFVGQRPVFEMRIGNTGSLAAGTFDGPLGASLHQPHLASLPPPLIDVAGQGYPDLFVVPQFLEVPEQLPVDVLCALRKDVVGVDDKANESVASENQ